MAGALRIPAVRKGETWYNHFLAFSPITSLSDRFLDQAIAFGRRLPGKDQQCPINPWYLAKNCTL
jgi:hypothetical protein